MVAAANFSCSWARKGSTIFTAKASGSILVISAQTTMGVFVAAFAVGGGPEAAGEEGRGGAGHVPEEIVAEEIEAAFGGAVENFWRRGLIQGIGGGFRVGFELVPCTGVDVLADALHVEEAFGFHQGFGVEAQVVKVIVPAGVLAEGGKMNLRRSFGGTQEARKTLDEGHD